MIKIKRIYDPPADEDSERILVDRLWPRGLSKEKANVVLWLKEIAPSNELRKSFCHDPEKWGKFKKSYFKELDSKKELVSLLSQKAKKGNVTLLYGAKDEKNNNALALMDYLKSGKKRKKK
jgi:uncharacterized protein YeaO (DUF488 family)